jgi:hypothetical protein
VVEQLYAPMLLIMAHMVRQQKGKPIYMLPEHPNTPPTKEVTPGVDQEASWVKKGSKLQYGYKRHYLAAETPA